MMDTNLHKFMEMNNIKIIHYDEEPQNLVQIVEEVCGCTVSSTDTVEATSIDPQFQVLHEHTDLEARYFKGGSATFIFDGGNVYHEVILKEGDLIIVPPNSAHCLKAQSQTYFNVIRFFTKGEGWRAAPFQKYNLIDDLEKSEKIVNKIRTCDIYAQHVYSTLCNNIFYKLINSEYDFYSPWSISWRSAGSAVANIRNNNEMYLDWYSSGNEGKIHYEFIDDLNDIGWDVYIEDDHR